MMKQKLLAYAEKLFVAAVGALTAATIYLTIAVQGRSILSMYTLDYFGTIALLSIPAFIVAANLGRPSMIAIIITVIVSIILLSYVFLQGFAMSFSDWVMPGEIRGFLMMAFLAVAALWIRRPQQILLFLAATAVSLTILVVGLQLAVRSALAQQFSATFAQGGCVIAGDNFNGAKMRKVTDQAEVRRGLFIGRDLEPVYFVFHDHYLKWSFSRMDVETRNGSPKENALTDNIRC